LKHWEIIPDNLSKAGWSWGCVSALDSEGRTIWIADAYRRAMESVSLCARMKKLTAFLELQSPLIRTRRNVGQGPTFFR
jgi:hypothetical protein